MSDIFLFKTKKGDGLNGLIFAWCSSPNPYMTEEVSTVNASEISISQNPKSLFLVKISAGIFSFLMKMNVKIIWQCGLFMCFDDFRSDFISKSFPQLLELKDESIIFEVRKSKCICVEIHWCNFGTLRREHSISRSRFGNMFSRR